MLKFALIGSNIGYSKSPDIYRYWFKLYKINAQYDLIDINNISELNNYNLSSYYGLNVTTPYKEQIVNYLVGQKQYKYTGSEYFLQTKSCNFIAINNSNLIIKNTDVLGLIDCFKKYQFNLSKKKILIIGIAGVTKSLVAAINGYSNNYSQIYFINRTKDKLASFLANNHFKKYSQYQGQKIDIIFNCTTLNINDAIELFKINNLANTILFDLNYQYTYGNKNIINGLDMLVFQARHNFFYWFGYYANNKNLSLI